MIERFDYVGDTIDLRHKVKRRFWALIHFGREVGTEDAILSSEVVLFTLKIEKPGDSST